MEFLKYEEDHKIYIDKKNKIVKKDDCHYEEYDCDGRVIKHFTLCDHQLSGIFLKKTYDGSGKMNCVIRTTYNLGKLNGIYELKRYTNEILTHIERSIYQNDKLNGYREIKQYMGKDLLYSFFCEYVDNIQNGYFKEVTLDSTKEGTYLYDKYDGLINVTYTTNNKREILLYKKGILANVIDASYVSNSITKSLIFSNQIDTVWRTGWYSIGVPVIAKCVVYPTTNKTQYIVNSTMHRIDRCKIIEIYDLTNEETTYSQYYSDMKNDLSVQYQTDQIVATNTINLDPLLIDGTGIYVYLYRDLAEQSIS
jgi:hypothetical protein